MEREENKMRFIRKEICRDWEDDEKEELEKFKMNGIK